MTIKTRLQKLEELAQPAQPERASRCVIVYMDDDGNTIYKDRRLTPEELKALRDSLDGPDDVFIIIQYADE